jgi:hypothetical protein
MTRILLALAVLTCGGCQWQELVKPTPPPKCYLDLWARRRDPLTGAVVDSTWLGKAEVACLERVG